MSTTAQAAGPGPGGVSAGLPQELPRVKGHHPIRDMVIRRAALGVLTLFLVSIVVFAATILLPGNAARAVLKNSATPERIRAVEAQLHLDRPATVQYWTWMTDTLRGDFGESLANGQAVSDLAGGRIQNSAVLVVLAGVLGTLIALALGVLAAARRDGWLDNAVSVISLAVTALPEYVVAIVLVMVFATNVLHIFPAISVIPPGQPAWSEPSALVLPVATLVVVIVPYIFRMMRGAMIEALESDYVEMANLKGVRRMRVLLVHSLPNAIAPTIQVIGLSFLYLAGGIVVVEYVFNYPGLGQGLVNAVANRDIPMIQFIVLVLATFYVIMNIVTDVVALWATPRRRLPR